MLCCVSHSFMSKSLRLHGLLARQAPLSMEFCRLEHWSGLPFLSPRHLPNAGIEPRSPALQADSLLSEPPGSPIYFIHSIDSIYINPNFPVPPITTAFPLGVPMFVLYVCVSIEALYIRLSVPIFFHMDGPRDCHTEWSVSEPPGKPI